MDDIGKMLGGSGGSGVGDIAGAIGGLVGGEGGLQGLVNQLDQAGLGDTVSSWISTGANKPVDPQALGDALGPDKVQQLSGQSGLDVGSLLPILAAALPTVIDAVTPDGNVPQGNAAAGLDVGGMLEGLSEAANAGPNSPLAGLGALLGGPKT
jgi:uncharacterized protein YidB (DUF937 family)